MNLKIGDLVLIIFYNEGFNKMHFICVCLKFLNFSKVLFYSKKNKTFLLIDLNSPTFLGFYVLKKLKKKIKKRWLSG